MNDVFGKSGNQVMMSLDQSAIEGMVKEQIGVQVAAVLAGSGEALVQQLVSETLNMKVDDHGKRATRSYDEKHTFITYACRKMVQEAVTEALNEWREKNKAKIKRHLLAHLKKHPDAFLERVAEGAANGLDGAFRYSFNTKVHVNTPDDD